MQAELFETDSLLVMPVDFHIHVRLEDSWFDLCFTVGIEASLGLGKDSLKEDGRKEKSVEESTLHCSWF